MYSVSECFYTFVKYLQICTVYGYNPGPLLHGCVVVSVGDTWPVNCGPQFSHVFVMLPLLLVQEFTSGLWMDRDLSLSHVYLHGLMLGASLGGTLGHGQFQ